MNFLYNELKELQQILKSGNHFRENILLQKRYIRENNIQNGQNFELRLVYWNKRESGTFIEYINVEGFKNGMMLIEQYNKIGMQIGLKRVQLTLKDPEKEIKIKDYFWKSEF